MSDNATTAADNAPQTGPQSEAAPAETAPQPRTPPPAPVIDAGPTETGPVGPEPETAPEPEPRPFNRPAGHSWSPPRRHRLTTAAILLFAAAALVAILYGWGLPPFADGATATENAYVRGRTTVIAPQVSGYVVEVAARDYQDVRRGQVLARIDDRIYRARVAQAEATLDARIADLANSAQARASRVAGLESQHAALSNARAQLDRTQAEMNRIDSLVRAGWVTRRDGERSLAELRQTEAGVRQAAAAGEIARQDIRTVEVNRGALQAQVEGARAQLRLAQIDLENTIIRAPETGRLGEIGVRLGQYVTNGTNLMSLVPPDRWVIANFKESQTRRIADGQRASFTVDALGGARLAGHVERLSPAAGSEFSVLRPDNATGNFVKVPQRIGIRIVIDPGQPLARRLRPGMSVEARIETGSPTGLSANGQLS
jgi:multidrug resistance efflux pump